jgi:hypothetical protein
MVVEGKDSLEINLLVKLSINIGIAVLFTQSIFVLSSINLALLIEVLKKSQRIIIITKKAIQQRHGSSS